MNMYFSKVFTNDGHIKESRTCDDFMSSFPTDCSPVLEAADCGGLCTGGCGTGCWIIMCSTICVLPSADVCGTSCGSGCASTCKGHCTDACSGASFSYL